jgi:hypothetical protein
MNFNFVIVSVQVLALSPVAAQLVRTGKIALDHNFELSGHVFEFQLSVLKFPGGLAKT